MCDLLEPLFENAKEDIFGEIINRNKPPKKDTGPALSTMKKDQLITECKRLGVDDSGKVSELRERIKRIRSNTLEDLFKRYEQDINRV